ncbi:wall-associated receptor kinase-like 6 [Pyrus x bretschneideri]|uniref:wall-associated receptor kinase-like 6 n=1 Tax=Pyrus x bretschneideri TaxID=225117 RepID=UPI00202F1D8A|nr:wall-associated receptor kinase-like 6 [Pyrus x bretschneideri]
MNNYDKNNVHGQGSFGTVYKGVLSVNTVIVLSWINHRNVVKLLGCCLETGVPLLVYKSITNGNLYSHIYDRKQGYSSSVLSCQTCLKVAIKISGALLHLHSETYIPINAIIHRDVKTANILLDEDYTAKISNFGTSRLIWIDESHLTTLARGTFGYLDPEYSLSSQLTEKSDVYSFRVSC